MARLASFEHCTAPVFPSRSEEQASRLARLLRAPQHAWQFFGNKSLPYHFGRWMCCRAGDVRGSYAWQKAITLGGRMLGRTALSDNFLVLSSARSGTTAMVDYLNCHPRIRCRGEVLNPDYKCYGNPRRMRAERLKLHIESFFVKPAGVVAGAKILNYQLDEMPIGLSNLIETLHRPKIILLYREQVLEQYASLKLAERSGVWHANKPAQAEPIRLDPEDFVAFAARERRMWNENLAALEGRCQAHFVTYDELLRKPREAMRGVFDFLELKNCRVEAFVAKLHDRPLSKKLANYQDFVKSGIAAANVLRLSVRQAA